MIDSTIIEVLKMMFTFLGPVVTAYFSYKAVKASQKAASTSLDNHETITKVAQKIDGLLDEKTLADKAKGNLEGRAELRGEREQNKEKELLKSETMGVVIVKNLDK